MSSALLEKARAILAHPRQRTPREAKTLDVRENNVPQTKPMIPTHAKGGGTTSHAALVIQNVEMQPAEPNAKVVYWEAGNGSILGPAVPEFLGRDGNTFWIVTTFRGQIRWINANRLRRDRKSVV